MTRARILVISTTILATAGVLMGTAAYGVVTNPAKNPHRIEFVAPNGFTYVDGQDTLPGYDDIDCTFIPGAEYDFDNNRVYFTTIDNKRISIPWTEWERIAGYDTWLQEKQAAQQQAQQQSSSATTSNSSSPKNSSSTVTTASDDESVTEVAGAGEEPEVSASPSAEPSPSVEPSAEPSPVAEPVLDAAPPADVADASGAGRVILIGLFGAGVVTFLAYEIVRRRGGKAIA